MLFPNFRIWVTQPVLGRAGLWWGQPVSQCVSYCSDIPYSWELQHLFRACHHHSWYIRSVNLMEQESMWSHMTRCSRIHDPWLLLLCVFPFLLGCFRVHCAVNYSTIFGNCWGKHHHDVFPTLFILFLLSLFLLGILPFTFEVLPLELAFFFPFSEQFWRVCPCVLRLG